MHLYVHFYSWLHLLFVNSVQTREVKTNRFVYHVCATDTNVKIRQHTRHFVEYYNVCLFFFLHLVCTAMRLLHTHLIHSSHVVNILHIMNIISLYSLYTQVYRVYLDQSSNYLTIIP